MLTGSAVSFAAGTSVTHDADAGQGQDQEPQEPEGQDADAGPGATGPETQLCRQLCYSTGLFGCIAAGSPIVNLQDGSANESNAKRVQRN